MPNSWLDLLVDSTKALEPPESFFWWAGVATIAAIVKKNVFLDRFSYTLYPNVYVILVSAKSGLRKGIPVGYARGILKNLDCTRVISGQNSMPDIIHELAQQITTKNGKVFSDAQALLCAPEFDSFILDDPKALPTLTDLYDTHAHHSDGWNKGLKSGQEFLKSPCINLLAASNEEMLADMVKTRDIKGGFMARSFIVHASKRKTKNSLMDKPKDLVGIPELAEGLKRLVDLKGQFSIPAKVRRQYTAWYDHIDEESDDPTGTMERIGDSVLKVAMLISLAESNSLVIDEESMELAIQRCEGTLSGVRRVSMDGKFEISPIVAAMVKLLIDSPGQEVERPRALQKIGCEPLQLDRAIDQLFQQDAIHEPGRRPNYGPVFYKMKKETYEAYLNFRRNQP